jgi:integrase
MASFEKRTSSDGRITYRAKIRVAGYPPINQTFESKKKAERWAQRIEADMHDGKYFPHAKAKKKTVSDLIDRYLDDLADNNPSRHGDVKNQLVWWKSQIGKIGVLILSPEHILDARKKLLARITRNLDENGNRLTLSPATANRYTAALHTAMNYGVYPLQWIEKNPLAHVKKLKEPNGRTRFLSENEITRLIDACKASKSKYLLAAVLCGIATGGRRSEIETLRWRDMSADGRRITLLKTKNGEIRNMHVTGPAYTLLTALREKAAPDAIYVFPSPRDPNRPLDFQTAWKYALDQAGIEDFRFHDLRHTCASYLAMNGASLLDMAEILGHKTLQMVKRYAHLTQSHTAGVVGNMTGKVLGNVEI